MAGWERVPSPERVPAMERESSEGSSQEEGWKGWGRGGRGLLGTREASVPRCCPFGIQGVHQYNEAGPLIYHLFGNVIAFLAPCVFFVIGLHSSTVRSTLKPPYSTALLVIAFHDLSQHS